jgi:PAS domain S-box-containing protein
MTLLFFKYHKSDKQSLPAKQVLVLGLGFGIPLLSGVVFEMVLPFILKNNVFPITVSLMSLFSLSAFIVIRKYRLLDFSPLNQWEVIINSLEEAVFITDNKDNIMYVNDTFCKMVQARSDRLIGTPAGNFFPESVNFSDVEFTIGKKFNTQLLTSRGDTIWVQVSSSDYKFNNENIGHIALVTNINTIKQTRENLAVEQHKVKMAIETGQMVSYNVNLESRHIELSENATSILGLKSTKGSIDEIIFPNIDASFKLLFEKVAEEQFQDDINNEIVEFIRPDNHQSLWLEVKGSFIKNNFNGQIQMQGLLIDITQDKQKTYELFQLKLGLERNQRRLLQAQEIAHLGSWEIDLIHSTTVWSDEAYRIYGITPGNHNIQLDEWLSYVHPDDVQNVKSTIENQLQKKENHTIEHRIVRKDGSIKYVRLIVHFEYNKDITVFNLFGIIQDITESKAYENKLKKLLEITEKQNKSLQNFAYIVSHNIRSHSANISGLSDIIHNENTNKVSELLVQSSHKLSETINNLNSIITMQNASDKNFHSINLREQITKTIDAVNHFVILQNASIKNLVSDQTLIDGIPSYIESILLNLITNAIKYKKENESVEITISSSDSEDYTILSIKDNGRGIDLNKYKNSIFGLYKTFHGNKDANGMGLFIVKNQIESMHGKIEVESTVNEGSEFKVFFNKNPFEFEEILNA